MQMFTIYLDSLQAEAWQSRPNVYQMNVETKQEDILGLLFTLLLLNSLHTLSHTFAFTQNKIYSAHESSRENLQSQLLGNKPPLDVCGGIFLCNSSFNYSFWVYKNYIK